MLAEEVLRLRVLVGQGLTDDASGIAHQAVVVGVVFQVLHVVG